MAIRLHSGGRFRSWLGARFGGDAVLGDRIWRRSIHLFGLFALLYYLLPARFFVVLTLTQLLLVLLGVVAGLEVARLLLRLELPAIRPFEERRIASYVYFAVGLVVALLLFPAPIGMVAIAGTSLFDPVIGELRLHPAGRRFYPALPLAGYTLLALALFRLTAPWPWADALALALVGATAAIAVERPNHRWIDDDLAMTLVPGFLLWALVLLGHP